jgi:hypothetical protein
MCWRVRLQPLGVFDYATISIRSHSPPFGCRDRLFFFFPIDFFP